MFAETLKKVVDNVEGGIAAVIMGLDGISTERTIELVPSVTLSQDGRFVRSYGVFPNTAAALTDPGRIVNDRFWCNVVKVQHHGSENNLSQAFAGTVLADHYVFCADGHHDNPDPSVVKTIVLPW